MIKYKRLTAGDVAITKKTSQNLQKPDPLG